GGEPPEGGVEVRQDLRRRQALAAGANAALSGDHDRFARPPGDRLPDHLFRAVSLGRVEEVDAQVERGANQTDGIRLALSLAEPELAVTTATEARHADPQPRASERPVLHALSPLRP